MKLHKDLIANAATIPDTISIFTADFDTADALKEQYGVTKKHTSVYFDQEGWIRKVNTAKEHSLQDILDEFATE